MHIEDALDRFIVQLRADGRSEHTVGQYRRHIRLLGSWIARERQGAEIEQLDHEDLATFLNAPTARQRPDSAPKKPNTMNALRTSVRCLFSYVHAAGWSPTNPARLVRRAICSPGPPRAMSGDEVKRLLAALKRGRGTAALRDHALFAFMLGTGVRLSSALTLRVEDVDLRHGEVLLRRMKGGRTDIVSLSPAAQRDLAGYLGDRRSGVVFPGTSGRHVSRRHAHRRFLMWLRAAAIQRHFSPHALRHTFAAALYSGTQDLLLVQQALGHVSLLSTAIYARTHAARRQCHALVGR